MAQIDLKNVDFYIQDGYAGPTGASGALVNLMAGYMAGATTMAVDGITGSVVTGDRFTVVGDTVIHTVTSHTETLGNTTSITFTPALGSSVADDAAITWLPHKLAIKIGEGNLQWTEKRPIVYTKNRGRLDTVKKGDEEPVEVKFDFTWVFLKSDSGDPITIEEALKKNGAASSWVSSSPDPCEPYSVDIIALYTPPCSGVKTEVYTIGQFRYEDLGHDLKQGQVSVTGKCNLVEITTARV